MSHNPYPIPTKFLNATAVAASRRAEGPLLTFLRTWTGETGAALLGRTGAGKSLCAALACERVRRKSGTEGFVKWIRADELSRLLTERSGIEDVRLLKEARVLVIDDMGYERWHETLLEVVGHRYDRTRPTVVTSGFTQSEFSARYSDATIRRIAETGDGLIVDCWASKQKQVAR